MNRRSFITGLAGILAASQAPWVVSNSGILMRTRAIEPVFTPDYGEYILSRISLQPAFKGLVNYEFSPIAGGERKVWTLPIASIGIDVGDRVQIVHDSITILKEF